MSGHSKWSTIKRKKGAADAKRGQLFTKLGRAIAIAARDGGSDTDTNFSLRLAVDKARQASMPSDNIERAIKRGTGELEGEATFEKGVYGGYGPGGVAYAVDVLTDNKNRTVSDLRKIFEDHGGNLSDASSVLWQFHEKGLVVVKCAKIKTAEKFGEVDSEAAVSSDEIMMDVIDIDGVEDVEECRKDDETGQSFCEVITTVKQLAQVRDGIGKLGYIVDSAEIIKVPEQPQSVEDGLAEKVQSLVDALEGHDDVENVWTTMTASE